MLLNKTQLKEYVELNNSKKSQSHLLFLTEIQKESLMVISHAMGMSMNEFIRRSIFLSINLYEEEID
jgi:hypothetical protein